MFALTIAPNIAFNHTGIITVLQFLVGLVSTELVFVLRLYTVLKFTLWLLHRHDMLEIIFHSLYKHNQCDHIHKRAKVRAQEREWEDSTYPLLCSHSYLFATPPCTLPLPYVHPHTQVLIPCSQFLILAPSLIPTCAHPPLHFLCLTFAICNTLSYH